MCDFEGKWYWKGPVSTWNKLGGEITTEENLGTAEFKKLNGPFYEVTIFGPGYTLKNIFVVNLGQLDGSFNTFDSSIFYFNDKGCLREKFTTLISNSVTRYGDIKFSKKQH
jgi:hypothetical protein